MAKIEASWLNSKPTQTVFALLRDAGHQVFAVGGCVRNALLNAPVKDIDLATDARPERVIALAKSDGLQAVPTGISHGTVTVLADGIAFEITTFRRDVETDGRRAVVAFSDRIEDDARRRDFTMNALYADAEGEIHDPLGGMSDLEARRIRFIENPVERIREDYLRSLRYFRFHAWYGNADAGFDAGALDAIAGNVDGLADLSKERIGAELKRLLEAPDPVMAVAGMRTTGVLAAVLPGADDSALGPLVHLESEAGAPPDAMRRLSILGGASPCEALRLSRRDTERLRALRDNAGLSAGEAGYRLGPDLGRDVLLVTAASTGSSLERGVLDQVVRGSAQVFPVKAADLMPGFNGPRLGEMLDRLERDWIASDFDLGRDDLIARAET